MKNILTYFEFFVKLKIKLANEGCKKIISVTVAKNGFYYVEFQGCLFNYANNKTFKLINNEYYDEMSDFYEGICLARRHNTLRKQYNFIKEDGTLLVNKTYSNARRFSNGFAVVNLNYGYNYIDTNGNLLSNDIFTEAHSFSCGRGLVRFIESGKYLKGFTYIKPNGDYIDKFFGRGQDFKEDRAIVYRYDGYNKISGYTPIDLDGNFLTDENFTYMTNYKDGFSVAQKGGMFGQKYLVDKNGSIVKELDE